VYRGFAALNIECILDIRQGEQSFFPAVPVEAFDIHGVFSAVDAAHHCRKEMPPWISDAVDVAPDVSIYELDSSGYRAWTATRTTLTSDRRIAGSAGTAPSLG
jgi:hypothetical protein